MTTTRLTPEQQALCSDPKHLEMARRLARRYARRCPWLADEFESAAMLGLVDAATRFDPARGLAFGTFAGRRIVGQMVDAVRFSVPKGYRRKAAAPATGGDVYALPSGDLPVGWEIESQDAVRAVAARVCSPKKSMVLRLLFTHAAANTMAKAGRAARVHETRVSQILQESARLIRLAAGRK